MALRVGCTMADRVAAVAAVAAALPKTMICLPARPIPALFIHGTDDPVVHYDGGTYTPGRFKVLSAEDSAKAWARFDRCEEKPAQGKLPASEKNAKETKTMIFGGCHEGVQVALYSVKNGGSTWPGGEQYMAEKQVGKTSEALNANDAVWNFFAATRIAGDDSGK
jgi:polyhydroxybutyrate depolymerase